MRLAAIAALMLLMPLHGAEAQQTVLQARPWAAGHLPTYSNSAGSQPIVTDGGTAAGGPVGSNPSGFGFTSSSATNTYPVADGGPGPLGTHGCMYDAPTTNATGYHYLCFDPNAAGGGLITYGARGAASGLPLWFNVNGAVANLSSLVANANPVYTTTLEAQNVTPKCVTYEQAGTVVDCHNAMVNAINSFTFHTKAGGGGIIQLGTGTYVFGQPTDTFGKTGLTVAGQGWSSTLVASIDNANYPLFTDQGSVVAGTGAVTLRDFMIHCGVTYGQMHIPGHVGTPNALADGIYWNYSAYGSIRNVWIDGCTKNIHVANVWSVLLNHVRTNQGFASVWQSYDGLYMDVVDPFGSGDGSNNIIADDVEIYSVAHNAVRGIHYQGSFFANIQTGGSGSDQWDMCDPPTGTGSCLWMHATNILADSGTNTTSSLFKFVQGNASSMGELWMSNVWAGKNFGDYAGAPISTASWSGGVLTVTLTNAFTAGVDAPPVLTTGDRMTVMGVSPNAYNGTYTTTGVSGAGTVFTAALAADPGAYVSGGGAVDIDKTAAQVLIAGNGTTTNLNGNGPTSTANDMHFDIEQMVNGHMGLHVMNLANSKIEVSASLTNGATDPNAYALLAQSATGNLFMAKGQPSWSHPLGGYNGFLEQYGSSNNSIYGWGVHQCTGGLLFAGVFSGSYEADLCTYSVNGRNVNVNQLITLTSRGAGAAGDVATLTGMPFAVAPGVYGTQSLCQGGTASGAHLMAGLTSAIIAQPVQGQFYAGLVMQGATDAANLKYSNFTDTATLVCNLNYPKQ